MANKKLKNALCVDILIISTSIILAVTLIKTGLLLRFVSFFSDYGHLGSFIAGLFFTSAFTIAPSIVTLSELALSNTVIDTALFGAMGAVVGDLIIFIFVRDRFGQHIMELLKHKHGLKRFRMLSRLKFFHWLTFLFGGIIIASPLPDELGIGILGFSKLKISTFTILSFTLHFVGIYFVGPVAKTFF